MSEQPRSGMSERPRSGMSERPGAPALAAILVAVLVAGFALGWLAFGDRSDPVEGSVDVGFARDMGTHHAQAVEMAGWVRDRTTDPMIRTLAFDIETSQQFQVGEMVGWLTSWGVPTSYPADAAMGPMDWMAAAGEGHDDGHATTSSPSPTGSTGSLDAVMPGMATEAELAHLRSLQGTELDVYFLQLMIRHHEGGVPMAEAAAAAADEEYVRRMASAIVTTQSAEVTLMTTYLTERGGVPLPLS